MFAAEPESLWQKVLPTGRALGRTPSTLLLEPGKPAIGIFLRAAVLSGVAEHVREAGEDMTNGRTSLGRFCGVHCTLRLRDCSLFLSRRSSLFFTCLATLDTSSMSSCMHGGDLDASLPQMT